MVLQQRHSGLYTCRSGSDASSDGFVYLSVLSNFPPYSKSEDTLYCSLWRFSELDLCPEKSFRWLDETGTELTEGVWVELRGPRICVSSLTMKDQSNKNRNFTCQFVEGNRVKIETHHTPSRHEVDRGEPVHLYHRAGDEAVLPCNRPSSSDSCSSVDWIYKRKEDMNYEQEVHNGIVQSSPRSARMSLDQKCSLIINNITKVDAGCYKCLWDKGSYETHVHLNVMIIFSSAPHPDPTKNGDVTLLCFLVRVSFCPDKSLLWLNETGSELTGEGEGYRLGGQTGCVSFLTVNLQSSRRFTCQFVEENEVKIEAHYGSESKGPPASSPLSFIMLTLKITGLILMVGITVGIIRTRGRKKPQKDIKVRFAADDTVDYENDGESFAAAALH